jgi:hypothetical protein
MVSIDIPSNLFTDPDLDPLTWRAFYSTTCGNTSTILQKL